jgi:cellulose biosynthesis protein BcsQ
VSRFYDAVRRADEVRARPRAASTSEPVGEFSGEGRPFQVVSVVSSKGGVGKTTVATNLAVYVKAFCEDLPVLVLSLDDQMILDRMFELPAAGSGPAIAAALRSGSLAGAVRQGQYGVCYVRSSPDVADLKREIDEPTRLRSVLLRSGWRGLVIVDTKADLEILTRNALAAADLALVVVRDEVSLLEGQKVFRLLHDWRIPRERARVLLAMIDRRVKYARSGERDVLSLLVGEVRRRGYPLFDTFISHSPKIESLATNPEHRVHTILHGAPTSLVHRQMSHLAQDVIRLLAAAAGKGGLAAESPAAGESAGAAQHEASPLAH